MRIIALATFAIFLHAGSVFAWGANGHRITAKIGEDNLTSVAAERLKDIVGDQSLALMATWPDFVRSFSEYDCFKPWHFLTVDDGTSIDDARSVRPNRSGSCDMDSFNALGMPANVVDAITYFSDILDGDAQKAADFAQMLKVNGAAPYNGSIEQTALALVVHLVGDVHQPLHVGKGPDRGGNTITVDWFGENMKLHEVWDEALIERQELSYTEFAAFLEQRFGTTDMGDYGDGSQSWAQESVGYRGAVYDFGGNAAYNVPRLEYKYAAKQDRLIKERLYQGGMRLSAVLNAILLN